MLIKHYFVNKIAHSSYILAGQKTCYSTAGYARECKVCDNSHVSRFFTDIAEVKPYWD